MTKNHCVYQVRRGSILYRACSLAVIMPTNMKETTRTVITDHVVNLALTWAFCGGSYNPVDEFKEQERRVFDFLLHQPIPPTLMYPMHLVRLNLVHIFFIRKIKNSRRMRMHRKAKL